MKLKCRKCEIVFTIPEPMPSDISALNKAECGAGYGKEIDGVIVHEIRGHLE